jgi:hypothetical protein
MPQRDEIDEVIRVEMTDEDGIEGARLDLGRQPWKGTLPEVEQDGGPVVADQVRGASRTDPIRVCRPGAQDRQLHARTPSIVIVMEG